MANTNPKSRMQERVATTRPKLGEFKQLFRSRVAQKGKELRMQRTMELRTFNFSPEEGMEVEQPAMEEDNPDEILDLRSWLEQQWLQFAEEEGINNLSPEEAEELLNFHNEIYENEKRQYG